MGKESTKTRLVTLTLTSIRKAIKAFTIDPKDNAIKIVAQNPNRDYLVGKAIEELRIYAEGDYSFKHIRVAAQAILLLVVFHHTDET